MKSRKSQLKRSFLLQVRTVLLWVTVISNFTNFQVETSITIEQLPSSIDSENPEVVKKSVLIYVFITVSYALIGSLVFNIILLPKSCNGNPETPIMKLEYQIQEWWNSKWNCYVNFCFGFVGYFLFIIKNLKPEPTFKNWFFYECCIFMFVVSMNVFMNSVMFERDFIFKDSSDLCKRELTIISDDRHICLFIAVLLFCLFPCLRLKD